MKYKSDYEYSYTLGAFPTFELLQGRPGTVREVYIHPSFEASEHAQKLRLQCAERGIAVRDGAKVIQRISPKENVYVVGVFSKFTDMLDANAPHLLLDRVTDMGNLGTIMRTALGFGYRDIAIVTPAADAFHPKTVRASMGALFKLHTTHYASLEAYRAAFPQHSIYAFMLDGEPLSEATRPTDKRYTLAFGNEGEGLGDEYRVCTSLRIEQSDDVDSLNVTVAAAVAMYVFRR